jgi:hypothetical protein
MSTVFIFPAGNPRFSFATVHAPFASLTSRLRLLGFSFEL